MLQYPAFTRQNPWSTRMVPTSFLLPAQWPQLHNDDLLLAMEESDFEDKCSEIRKANSNIIVFGKTTVDNDKEDYDNDADDEEADNVEESEGDEFDEIRKANSNIIVIGKTIVDNDKEDYDNDADDEEADNVEESEGDEFE